MSLLSLRRFVFGAVTAAAPRSRFGRLEDFMNTRRFRIAGPPLAIIGLFLCCSGEPAQAYVYGAAPFYPADPGGCYDQGGYEGDGYSYGDPYCDGWGSAYGSGGAFGSWSNGNGRGMYGHGSFGRGSRGAAGRGGFSRGRGGHGR